LVGNFIPFPDINEQNDTTAVNYEEAALASSSGDYRMPLVWIDLEMTGESSSVSVVHCHLLVCSVFII